MRSGSWLLAVAFGVAACATEGEGATDEDAEQGESELSGAQLRWSNRLPFAHRQPGVLPVGGSEIRSLAAMGGSLYAANGYWRDPMQDDAATPGPQVLRLDSPAGNWAVDLQLDERITHGANSGLHRFQAIGALASFALDETEILLASTWDRTGGLRVFARANGGAWSDHDLVTNAPAQSQVRSFGHHRDAVTGTEAVFAGASPNGIFRGVYDPVERTIRWESSPETFAPATHPKAAGARVLAFAEANGKLYATIGWTLWERQDAATPEWKEVFALDDPPASVDPDHYALRGATAVSASNGAEDALLFGVEGRPMSILRVEPKRGFAAVTELDGSTWLTQRWGTPATYGIAAYNGMTTYEDPATPRCPKMLVGFEVTTPAAANGVGARGKHPFAHFLVRDCHGGWDVRKIVDPQEPYADLVATRAMLASPFASDPAGTLYAGGFDAGNMSGHNTAWLYRGSPR